MMVYIFSSGFGNIKSYMKEEERIVEKIQKFPCFYHKGNEGYKEKGWEKTHGVKFSVLNEMPNLHILFENVTFVINENKRNMINFRDFINESFCNFKNKDSSCTNPDKHLRWSFFAKILTAESR